MHGLNSEAGSRVEFADPPGSSINAGSLSRGNGASVQWILGLGRPLAGLPLGAEA